MTATPLDQQQLRAIVAQFNIPGEFTGAEPYGTGHINDTYRGLWRQDGRPVAYILQRINHQVFKDPPRLMDNIVRVTSHLRRKLEAAGGRDPNRETLTVIPTRAGATYHRDAAGNYWRAYIFIVNARTYDICTESRLAYEAARAFGVFQAALADLPGARLHDTIPWFHHTPRRFQALEQAIQADAHNRCAGARDAIDFCLKRRPLATALTDLLESGRIPERITHNDTKINNVMIDNDSGKGVCVIDLDTVMPGCALYDIGDMIRSTARTTAEDERDLAKVGMDPAMYRELVRGYLDSARTFLTPTELEAIPVSGQVITFTIGVRFLTDYLSGDTYFKIHRPGHNLDRARVQFAMIESMERQDADMRRVVRELS